MTSLDVQRNFCARNLIEYGPGTAFKLLVVFSKYLLTQVAIYVGFLTRQKKKRMGKILLIDFILLMTGVSRSAFKILEKNLNIFLKKFSNF